MKLVALGVSSSQRSPLMRDVPTIAEQGIGDTVLQVFAETATIAPAIATFPPGTFGLPAPRPVRYGVLTIG